MRRDQEDRETDHDSYSDHAEGISVADVRVGLRGPLAHRAEEGSAEWCDGNQREEVRG
jgi:hypothetical protein